MSMLCMLSAQTENTEQLRVDKCLCLDVLDYYNQLVWYACYAQHAQSTLAVEQGSGLYLWSASTSPTFTTNLWPLYLQRLR